MVSLLRIRIKKISIKKALRAASKKVFVEWPSYLYSHIKEIRKGYNISNKFRNSQIFLRPSATINKLVKSNRQISTDRWEYFETLSFPLNPSDIDKFGQKSPVSMTSCLISLTPKNTLKTSPAVILTHSATPSKQLRMVYSQYHNLEHRGLPH